MLQPSIQPQDFTSTEFCCVEKCLLGLVSTNTVYAVLCSFNLFQERLRGSYHTNKSFFHFWTLRPMIVRGDDPFIEIDMVFTCCDGQVLRWTKWCGLMQFLSRNCVPYLSFESYSCIWVITCKGGPKAKAEPLCSLKIRRDCTKYRGRIRRNIWWYAMHVSFSKHEPLNTYRPPHPPLII